MIVAHILVLNQSLYGEAYDRANTTGAVIGAVSLSVPSGIGGYFLGKKAEKGSGRAKGTIVVQTIIGVTLFIFAFGFLGFHPQ